MNLREVWISFDWISHGNHGYPVKLNLKNCYDLDSLKTHLMRKIQNHSLHKYGVIIKGDFVYENEDLDFILKNNSQKNPLVFVKISKSELKVKIYNKQNLIFY